MKTVYVIMEDSIRYNEFGCASSSMSYPIAVFTSKEEAEKANQKLWEEEKARIRECEETGYGTAVKYYFGIEATGLIEK